MVKKESSHLRVKLEEPRWIRKDILEGAMNSGQLLKSYKIYKSNREKKIDKMYNLRKVIKELKLEMGKLKNKDLPKVVERKKILKPIPEKEDKRTEVVSELDRELEDLRDKLKNLDI